jgi:hypothetical protein
MENLYQNDNDKNENVDFFETFSANPHILESIKKITSLHDLSIENLKQKDQQIQSANDKIFKIETELSETKKIVMSQEITISDLEEENEKLNEENEKLKKRRKKIEITLNRVCKRQLGIYYKDLSEKYPKNFKKGIFEDWSRIFEMIENKNSKNK